MHRNKALIIVLCVVLGIALGILIVCERRYPEAGSEFMRRVLSSR